jgi:hypothetical protein
MMTLPPLDTAVLPAGIRSRFVDDVTIFISGKSDWGVYQRPGAVERMQGTACTRMVACHLLDGAGHWVQQEQARRVGELLVEFLRAP